MEEYLKNRKVKLSFKEDIEPQEILLDQLASKREQEMGISRQRFETPLLKKTFWTIFLSCLGILLILFGKTFQFQIFETQKFSAMALNNMIRHQFIRPQRGVIYDCNGQQLVFNKPSFDLVYDKRVLMNEAQKKKTIKQVSEIINKDPRIVAKTIAESESNRVLILKNIPHQTLILLKMKIRNMIGFYIEQNTVRDYVDGKDFAHLLGYTAKISQSELRGLKNYSVTDYIGRTGLEQFYESVLRGTPGLLQIKQDVRGRELSKKVITPPVAGRNIKLWLDADLQRKVVEVLQKGIKKAKIEKASAIALDPNTGGVLSLVSLPSFDNNKFSQGISSQDYQALKEDSLHPLWNRVTLGEYAPGSTIKPLLASAGLQEGLIVPRHTIYCKGEIDIANKYYPQQGPKYYRYRDWKAHGLTDLYKAIAQSCNVYFYRLGGGYKDFKGLGVERIKKYLELFGWGSRTDIDLPQETKGFIPDPDWKRNNIKDDPVWHLGNTYHLSIGQEYIGVSPLQVATAFSAIANGGTLYKPRVIRAIVDNQGEIIEEMSPEIARAGFIDPQNLKIVRKGMRQAVTSLHGSSHLLNSLLVKAAAKTGTAQTQKKGYYHNWVTVFAPYQNPQIVLTVVFEDVKGEQMVAVPAAKEILEFLFKTRP